MLSVIKEYFTSKKIKHNCNCCEHQTEPHKMVKYEKFIFCDKCWTIIAPIMKMETEKMTET